MKRKSKKKSNLRLKILLGALGLAVSAEMAHLGWREYKVRSCTEQIMKKLVSIYGPAPTQEDYDRVKGNVREYCKEIKGDFK